MASRRKMKKKQKANTNGNVKAAPQTSMSEAMKKAQDNAGKKQPKVIKGFGRKADGLVIHAVTNIDQSALCDVRIKDIPMNVDFTAKDVSCTKCQGYVIFKQLLETTTGHEPAEKAVTKATEKMEKDDKKPKTKEEEVDEEKEIEIDQEEVDGIMETVKVLLNQKLQKMEKRIIAKLEKYCENILDTRPVFFIARKANNMYQIIHDPSRYVICDNVKESDAEELLQKYLAIECKWDGQSKPSPEWLTAIRKIHEHYFPSKMAAKKAKQKERTLKRRRPRPSLKKRKDRKPEVRKIKRRQK